MASLLKSGQFFQRTLPVARPFVRISSSQIAPKKPDPEEPLQIGLNVTESVSWAVMGYAVATVLPPSIPSLVSTLVAAYFATRTAQPLVNTKLLVQRTQSNSKESFLMAEMMQFKDTFSSVMTLPDAHRGGHVYSMRGAVSKMLTFSGFEYSYDFLQSLSLGAPDFMLIPIAGMMTGFFQGSIVAGPEYLSSMQSRFPGKSNEELCSEMVAFTKETKGLPFLATALRNSVFDAVFSTLRVGFGLPFGPAALASMSANYPIERWRSLLHQHSSKKFEKENVFKGWFSKAVEFLFIYQLLQLLKSQAESKKNDMPDSTRVQLEKFLSYLSQELSHTADITRT